MSQWRGNTVHEDNSTVIKCCKNMVPYIAHIGIEPFLPGIRFHHYAASVPYSRLEIRLANIDFVPVNFVSDDFASN